MKIKCIYKLFFLAILLMPFTLLAQENIIAEHFTTKNGLSSDMVLDIHKDKYGFLWLATANGLNRFDGYRFKHYLPGSKQFDFPIDFIRKIETDKDGNFWLCGDGLLHFNISNGQVKKYSQNPELDEYLLDIETGNQENLWLKGQWNGTARFNYRTNSLQVFKNNPGNENSLSNSNVTKMFKDKTGKIWIGTQRGLNLFIPEKNAFKRFYLSNSNPGKDSTQVHFIGQFKDEELLIQLMGSLYVFDTKSGKFNLFRAKHFANGSFQEAKMMSITLSGDGEISFFNESQDIVFYDTKKEQYSIYRMENYEFGFFGKCFFKDRNDIVWVGDNSGLYKIDTKQQRFNWIYDKNSTKQFNITDLHVVDKNNLFAAFSNVLYKIEPKGQNKISYEPFVELAAGISVFSCMQDRDGIVWVGRLFLHRYLPGNKEESVFTPNDKGNGIAGYVIWDIMEDHEGNIWIGTGNGLSMLPVNEKYKDNPGFINFPHLPENPNGIIGKRIQKIFEDSKGNIWIGTDKGLTKYTTDSSYMRFSPIEKQNSLPLSDVISIQEDSKEYIWAGIQGGGLCKIIDNNNKYAVQTYTTFDGLPNNSVTGILEDTKENLWLSTYGGLSRFNTRTEKFTNFYESDGLRSITFSLSVYAKDEAGTFYFGSNNGVLYFQPENIKMEPAETHVIISEVSIRNTPVHPGDTIFNDVVLQQVMAATENIEITYKNNDFSLEFSVDNYTNPLKMKYKYRLNGYDKTWKITNADYRKAVYTNLPHGEYVFEVKATNTNGEWSKNITMLHIKIHPPWWKTWWAIMIYAAVIAGLSILLRKMILAPVKYRNQLKIERVQSDSQQTILKKEKELAQLRIRFFMNISHEFRTPLTLIRGLAEELFHKHEIPDKLKHQLVIIHRNSIRLTQLINQLLDFRKLETGAIKLNVQKGNLPALLIKIFESFNYQARTNEINYSVKFRSNKPDWDDISFSFTSINEKQITQFNKNNCEYWFDKDIFEKILTNLLANAFKFTNKNDQIDLICEFNIEKASDSCPAFVKIVVYDTGKGIPGKDLPHIFERFYQVKSDTLSSQQGNGIGLSLVKELAELHKGKIKVDSSENEYTSFEFIIPVKKSFFDENEMSEKQTEIESLITEQKLPGEFVPKQKDENIHKTKDRPVVLVIDDNNDMLDFIENALSDAYQIITCKSAKQALETVRKHIPDLIVSDVMMPGMDGFEFCRNVKNNELTSHIPVILLTALASDDNQIEGLAKGADDFITKPFNAQILKLRIKQQIDLREKWQKKFRNSFIGNENIQFENNPDKAFIDKAIAVVMKDVSNADFSQEDFASELGISKALLYRKLKAISGQSVNEFIRTIRVKQAANMLISTSLPINEIGYKVGFNQSGYFMRSFKKYYQKTPSEYRKTNS